LTFGVADVDVFVSNNFVDDESDIADNVTVVVVLVK
jgi:hypothetical protein